MTTEAVDKTTTGAGSPLDDGELDLFFELSIDLLCISSFDGYFKFMSPSWEKVVGFTPEELCARPYLDFVHPDDVQPTIDEVTKQQELGLSVLSFENRYLCKDGSYRWLRWTSQPNAERGLMYAVARDVTEEKRIAEELIRSNAELDEFTYVVSHDLKEPLRGIEAFSSFLQEDYADKLDEQGERYVTALREGAVRLRDLINDLLELSRVGRAETTLETVPFTKILAGVQADLDFSLRERGAEIAVVGELPVVTCDAVRISQVLHNLIWNGVKYNDEDVPRIEVSCESDDKAHTFRIRDNGQGFEPEYSEKIFGIFQRLVRREEKEGTGVGLTICKRITERHGGRIWAESDGPGQGATFCFTLPVSPSNSV